MAFILRQGGKTPSGASVIFEIAGQNARSAPVAHDADAEDLSSAMRWRRHAVGLAATLASKGRQADFHRHHRESIFDDVIDSL